MSYTQQPPSYAPPKRAGGYQAIPQDEQAPLAGASAEMDAAAPRSDGDVDPDDFKFGVTVSQSSIEIRQQFLKKVYTVLFLQILGTTVVGGIMSTNQVAGWLAEHQWAIIVPLIGSLVSLGLVFWKRHSHPLNLVFLGLFTLLESLSVGAVVAYVNQTVVLQALIITLFTFLGLTVFTLQSKWDFGSMGGWLFGGLMLLVGAGFVQLFLPYNKIADLVFASLGCVVFSLYIVYDTWLIQRRLSPEDWVLANVSLYLDIINLFLNILRILNGVRDD